MIKADGEIYVNTGIDTKGFNKDIKSLQSGVDAFGKSIKKLGVVIGSVFAVKELVGFGKSALDLRSDLQEVQNVVDVTFTTMSDKVDEFAKKAYKTAGLSETMAKQYAGTFGSMAKAFGFVEEDAYTMSTVLTQLTGDLASFKNLSQEEAFSKLKGVFTGETEALSNIGIVMTQTALDSYALEKGLSKTTKQMSEQEKVALRYQFVLDMLADANGDYVRTLGSWANQTKLLSTSISQLKATVGEGLINLFTPAIHVLNAIIERLMVAAEAFKVFTQNIMGIKSKTEAKESEKNISNLGDDYTETASAIKDYVDATESAIKSTKKMLSPLDNLNNITSDVSNNFSNTSFSGIGSIITKDEVSNMDDTLNEMEERAQSFVGNIEKFFKPIGEVIKNVFGKVEWKEISENLRDFKEAITPYAENFGEGLLEFFEDFGTVSVEVINDLFGKDGAITSLTDWLNNNDPEKAENWGYALGALVTGLIALTTLKGINRILVATSAIALGSGIGKYIISGLVAAIGGFALGQWLNELITGEEIDMSWAEQFDAIKESFSDGSWKDAIELMGKDLKEGFRKVLEDIGLIQKDFSDETTSWFEKHQIIVVRDFGRGLVDSFNESITNVLTSLGLLKGETNGLLDLIRKLNAEKVGFGVGGANVVMPNVPVPHLASGAVIPPNAPFMAMLGDQRNGTNIEAPLDTIKQAVAEVMANMNVNHGDIVVEISGNEVFRAVMREANMYTKQTGKPAF